MQRLGGSRELRRPEVGFLSGSRSRRPALSLKGLAHLKSGVAFFNQGRFQDARFQFEKAIALDPDYAPALCMLGRCYYELGEKDWALPLLRRGVEQQPNDVEAQYVLGLIYYDKGEFQGAVNSFKNALKANTDMSRTVHIHDALARSYRELGEVDPAIKECQAALVLEPDQEDIHGLIGGLFFEKGDLEQAIPHLEKAGRNDAAVQQTLAKALWEIGKRDDAISVVQNTIELFPDEAFSYSLLGYYLFETRRLGDAVAVLERAIDLFQEPDQGIVFLGSAYQEMGLFDKAFEVYQRLLETSPDDVSLLLRMGYVCMQKDDLEKMLEFFQRAVQVAPANAMARSALAYGWHLKGDLKAALNEIDQALAIDHNYGVAHQRKGYILQALGHAEGAIDEFEQAVSRGVIEALLDLAELYREAGNISKARQYVEQFMVEADKPENNELVDMTNYLEEAKTLLKELG
jgi:tetratricopeptide (TPR) repeat protein